MTLSIFYTNYLQLHWVHRCFRTYYICFSMACFVTYQTTIPASVRFPSDPMVNSFIAYSAVTATEIENIRYHCLWFYIYIFRCVLHSCFEQYFLLTPWFVSIQKHGPWKYAILFLLVFENSNLVFSNVFESDLAWDNVGWSSREAQLFPEPAMILAQTHLILKDADFQEHLPFLCGFWCVQSGVCLLVRKISWQLASCIWFLLIKLDIEIE